MAVQYSTGVRDGMMNSLETETSVSAILKLRTGAQPANCAAADSGSVVATMNLAADWMGASSGGVIAKAGTWEDASAAGGTAAHFRLYKTDGTTCVMQGTVGLGSGDLSLDNNVIVAGQKVTINTFQLTAPGA